MSNDLFTLYFDWKSVDLNGNERVYSNALIRKHNAISLKLRGLVCNRTTGISKNVVKKFFPVRKDIGIFADGLVDIQTQLFAENNYYSPFIGSIYYSGIGIGSRTNSIERLKSYINLWDEFQLLLDNISIKDKYWINFQKARILFMLDKNPVNLFHYFRYYFKSCEPKYGIKIMLIDFVRMITSIIK